MDPRDKTSHRPVPNTPRRKEENGTEERRKWMWNLKTLWKKTWILGFNGEDTQFDRWWSTLLISNSSTWWIDVVNRQNRRGETRWWNEVVKRSGETNWWNEVVKRRGEVTCWIESAWWIDDQLLIRGVLHVVCSFWCVTLKKLNRRNEDESELWNKKQLMLGIYGDVFFW